MQQSIYVSNLNLILFLIFLYLLDEISFFKRRVAPTHLPPNVSTQNLNFF